MKNLINNIKRELHELYCAFQNICPKHKTPLSYFGPRKSYCEECEVEEAQKNEK